MATAYTHSLCEGAVSFERFVLHCANAFTRYEEDEGKESYASFQEKELRKAKNELARLKSLSDRAWEREAKKQFEKAKAKYQKVVLAQEALRTRLLDMKKKVETWKPPTGEHVELKIFMIDQLKGTIEIDGDPPKPFKEHYLYSSGRWKEFKRKKLADARSELAYHSKSYKEESSKEAKVDRWMKALRKSLSS